MRKISILLAVMMAGLMSFSSCSKDEITANIKENGTVKVYVRGYSIGAGFANSESTPPNIKKGVYSMVPGYTVTLANGKTYTSDKNGVISISLEVGKYVIIKEDLPAGYSYGYKTTSNCSGGYSSCTYSFELKSISDKTYYDPEDVDSGYISIGLGTSEKIVNIFCP